MILSHHSVGRPSRPHPMRALSLAPVFACALALTLAGLIGPATPARASETVATGRATVPNRHRVIVVLAPYLTWSDLSAEKTPAIWAALGDAALGNMNARTADWGAPTYAGGAGTLSASRWVVGVEGGPIDAASLARMREVNEGSLSRPTLGLLGMRARGLGWRTIAVGASDTDTASPAGRLRYAELLAADASGTLDASYTEVLAADPQAPFGLRTDPRSLADAIARATALDAMNPQVIVVDTGDLARAHDLTATPAAKASAHAAALRSLDAAVGAALAPGGLGTPDTDVILVTPATEKSPNQEPAFGPLVIWGPEWAGEIVSASTRRPGLAVNLDIAPTVLASLGATAPAEMLGRPLAATPVAGTLEERIERLSRAAASPAVVDRLRDGWVLRGFCYLAIVGVLLASLVSLRPARWLSPVAEVPLVLAYSAMPAGWLMFLAGRQPLTTGSAAFAFVCATALVAIAALAIRRLAPRGMLLAPLFLAGLASLVIVADQLTGNPLESGIFSYSVAAGWRYYGMGNEGAAILVAASIAAVSLAVDALAARPRAALALRRYGILAIGALVVIVSAAPFAGANAGVAVWGVVAFGVAWAAMNGMRLSWRTAGLTLLGVVVAVVVFSAIDLLVGGNGGSHLSRFADGVLRGDVTATLELVNRKWRNNVGYLPYTPYTGLAIAMAAALAVLRFAPSRPFARAIQLAPAYSAALLGVIVGGLAAWATEDSGIVMPALMLFAGATPALMLALAANASTDH